jgi:TetR/AcrR family transcriptional regulator, transcriptional repressor for nem operon
MTDWPDTRADTTRQQILRVASHQFAKRPYYDVGIEDILAEAELAKGAMYFHFRSKYALALAIIEEQTTKNTAAVQDLLTRKLSGLETLVDVSYLIAVQDISQDVARAAFHLVETVGRAEGLQARVLGDWVQTLALIVARAIAEGDIIEQSDPQDVGRLFVSLYMGMRQTSDLDQPGAVSSPRRKRLGRAMNRRTHPSRMAATERSRAKAQFKARVTSL